MELVRFANSGTEANLLAITTGLKHTGRRKVVVFDGAYHGSLLCHFHAGDKPGEVEGVLRVPFDFIVAPYNDIQGVKSLVDPFAQEIGVILVEPMLGAGGCVPADPPFLLALREMATSIGAVLIFDEVQTSRLGPGGRQALLGITPDMTTVGKFFGGGFAFGAFGGKREIMNMFDVRLPRAVSHGGTFNNSPLTMIAGATAIEHILTPVALGGLNALGDKLRNDINTGLKAAAAPFIVTGLGSLNQLHSTFPTAEDRAAALDLMFFSLLDRGFWIAQRGLISLNFANTDDDVHEFVHDVVDVARHILILMKL